MIAAREDILILAHHLLEDHEGVATERMFPSIRRCLSGDHGDFSSRDHPCPIFQVADALIRLFEDTA